GDFCALVRWVSDLSIYYGSKNPQKTVRVPSYDIHQTLALIGNHLKACYEISDTRSSASKRNILVPFVSFVAKSNDGPRQFFEGDYLRFEDDERALAFISGPQSYSTEIYDQYTGYYNPIAEKKNFEQLPPIKMIAGDTASWFCEKDFSQINDECARKRKEKAYQFHTEEWLHEILNAEPQLAIDSVTRSLSPNDKVYAIIFDMYSLWDVCEHCQKKFKGELFSRKTITYLQNLLKAKNLKYPKNGIKVVFRVSSEQAYFSDITSEQLKYAGGGYNAEEGFDIKIIDSSQVSLCARQSPTYKEVSENVYRVISQIFKEEYW
ncbi:MAG: hypothetical protein Q8T08_13670, partial [Ignavibacteria bacterium]|nr:hypothetical protein [Ignavibacteria bacterium]